MRFTSHSCTVVVGVDGGPKLGLWVKASKAAYLLYQGSVHVVEFEIAVLVISDVCPVKPA